MTVYDKHQKLRTGDLPYFNGALLSIRHSWRNFSPANSSYAISVWARCTNNNRGYLIGDIVKLNRGYTEQVTATDIKIKIRDGGLFVVRKNGTTQNESAINPSRWLLFVIGEKS